MKEPIYGSRQVQPSLTHGGVRAGTAQDTVLVLAPQATCLSLLSLLSLTVEPAAGQPSLGS